MDIKRNKSYSRKSVYTNIRTLLSFFVIALVVSLPVYSAKALAPSIQIVKNSGEANIENYLDAAGDVWTVEALVLDPLSGEMIDPANVKIKIGQNEAPFSSCGDSPLGIKCEYISPLTEGIKEDEYAFQIVYNYLDELGLLREDPLASAVIKADASAPKVSSLIALQSNEKKIHLDFIVSDKYAAKPSVGLAVIEIINADTGEVLQTINVEEGKEEFDYVLDGNTEGILPASLEGEGIKILKVRAKDRLGHQTKNPPFAQFEGDFIDPVIKDDIVFTKFGKFIGEYIAATDIEIEVEETNLAEVIAFSDQAKLEGKLASNCEEDELTEGLWNCIWKNVEVNPESSVSITFVARDEKSNTAEKTISRSFTKDVTAPTIEYFAAERIYEEGSYVSSALETRLLLRVKEQGSGISEENIRADLQALGGSGSAVPNECVLDESVLECYWTIEPRSTSAGELEIGLSRLEDNVGNSGELPRIIMISDNTGPKVEKIEVFGASESEGEKAYFQSNDQVKIKLTAAEVSGLVILVDMNHLMMDAETKFPESGLSRGLGDGWQAFSEEECSRNNEGKWVCEVQTAAIKSGYVSSEDLIIKVRDTAGNEASWQKNPQNVKSGQDGRYKIEILGLDSEANPDYWEVSRGYPKNSLKFIDLDTTELTYTRMPLELRFNTDNQRVKALAIDLVGCSVEGESRSPPPPVVDAGVAQVDEGPIPVASEGPIPVAASVAPQISRALLYGGNFREGQTTPAKATLILEFAPFNGREMFNIADSFEEEVIPYTCQFKIYSKFDKRAIQAAEVQEVNVEVPFAFSELGSKDENIDALINGIKDDVWFQIPDKLKYINDILKIVRYIEPVIGVLISVNQIVNAINSESDAWRYSFPVYTEPLATALCAAEEEGIQQEGVWEVFEYLQVAMQVLSCNPAPYSNTWYGQYQQSILNAVNFYKSAGTRKVASLYDNIIVSTVGLCIPGIFHNLEKLRQIKCLHIDCLQNQVPNGATTIAGCQRVNDILECKYFWGEMIGMLIPMTSLWEGVKDMIKNALTNPLGLVRASLTVGCTASFCGTSGKGTAFCDVAAIGVMALDIAENIIGMVQQVPTISEDHCSKIGEGGLF